MPQLISDTHNSESQVQPPTVGGLPEGYIYGVTRYADVILEKAFVDRFADLCEALRGFHPTLDELKAGGGGRTPFVKRFDESLREMRHSGSSVWGKQKNHHP